MTSGLPQNPVVQQLDLLLTGYGFNYYNHENQARADDLLIRQQAAGSLSQAVGVLSGLHSAYRLRYLPPPTREQPFPPREEQQRASEILAVRDRVDRAAGSIHGMEAPKQDKIWGRLRSERETLSRLLSTDYLLISTCDRVRVWAEGMTPEAWRDPARVAEVDSMLREVDQTIQERRQILLRL
jgi:hypothetical protein